LRFFFIFFLFGICFCQHITNEGGGGWDWEKFYSINAPYYTQMIKLIYAYMYYIHMHM